MGGEQGRDAASLAEYTEMRLVKVRVAFLSLKKTRKKKKNKKNPQPHFVFSDGARISIVGPMVIGSARELKVQ